MSRIMYCHSYPSTAGSAKTTTKASNNDTALPREHQHLLALIQLSIQSTKPFHTDQNNNQWWHVSMEWIASKLSYDNTLTSPALTRWVFKSLQRKGLIEIKRIHFGLDVVRLVSLSHHQISLIR